MIGATPSQERAGFIKGIFFLMDVHLLGGPLRRPYFPGSCGALDNEGPSRRCLERSALELRVSYERKTPS